MSFLRRSGKDPLWLIDPNRWYRMESGSAAVFAAQRAGVRRFLFNLPPGSLIPPAPAPAGSAWQLLVLPLEPVTLSESRSGDGRPWIRGMHEILGSDEDAAHDFQTLNTTFYRAWPAIQSRLFEDDRHRLDRRLRIDYRFSGLGLARLASVAKAGAVAAEPQSESSPLLAACRAVGCVLGIQVRSAGDHGSGEDALQSIAQASKFRTRMVRLEEEWWKGDNGPLLGYWRENNSPVALLPSNGCYVVFEPSTGRRQPLDARTARLLDVHAHVLYRPFPDDISTRSLLRHAMNGRACEIRAIILSGVCVSLFALVLPQATGILVNDAIPDADRRMIWQVGAAILGASLGGAVFLITQAIATLRLQMLLLGELSAGFWDYALKLTPAFFRTDSAGSIAFKLNCLTRIQQMLTADVLRSLLSVLTSVVSIGLMFWYSVPLAVIGLICGAVIVAVVSWQFRRLLLSQAAAVAAGDETVRVLQQVVGAISKLRVATAERRAFALWTDAYSRRQAIRLQQQAGIDVVTVVNLTIPQVAIASSFYYMTGDAGAGLSLGAFLAFNAALGLFLTGLTTASQALIGLSEMRRLWARNTVVFTGTPEVDISKAHPGRLRGDIRIDRLTFRYRDDGPLILDDVSIHAAPGECIALTGPSGSGKSTLLNLLLRFEIPQSGAIYLDGKELSSLDIVAVRRQIGVVSQDGRIMSGTIYESLTSGGLASMEDALEAARNAGLADDIAQMPMGIHTMLSEGAANISGGQRQRLLIARALVRKPSILVFDEATSALDNRTQAIVTESLDRLKVTRILVAHRLNTIRNADQIYVIEAGRVTQHGPYEELAGQPGLFARLIQRQTA
jgi:NHLM bacteriocin system ABC transporter ATP-binding protein